MSVVESLQHRYEPVVAGTLETMAEGTDTVSYSVSGARVSMPCVPLDQIDENSEEEQCTCWHETSALQIVIVVDRGGDFHWSGSIDVPLEGRSPTSAEVQDLIVDYWHQMLFAHQAWSLSELDAEMDGIAEKEESEAGD